MSDWYRLDGRTVVGPIGIDELEEGVHHVGDTEIHGCRVSTVFLGLDHRWAKDEGDPLVFETMIFGGVNDQYQKRYTSYEAAEAGHAEACRLVEIGAVAAFVDVAAK
jgi:hypothetical protein